MTLWIALAGGLGAGLRFLLDSWIAARARYRLPLGTLVINLLGSFTLGVLVGRFGHASEITHVLGVGAMGGFTTFSAAAVESGRLWLDPRATRLGRMAGVLHALGMVVGAVLCAALGLYVGGV